MRYGSDVGFLQDKAPFYAGWPPYHQVLLLPCSFLHPLLGSPCSFSAPGWVTLLHPDPEVSAFDASTLSFFPTRLVVAQAPLKSRVLPGQPSICGGPWHPGTAHLYGQWAAGYWPLVVCTSSKESCLVSVSSEELAVHTRPSSHRRMPSIQLFSK